MNYGFFRVASCSLKLQVANPEYNTVQIKKIIDKSLNEGVRLLVTPELSITGYTCADLFFSSSLLDSAESCLKNITSYTNGKNIVVIVGAPVKFRNSLYNCAVVISGGKICGIVPKSAIPNYDEYYEKRWFASGNDFKEPADINFCGFNTKIGSLIFDLSCGVRLGVEICEDLWTAQPPSGKLSLMGANIIANPSAGDEYVEKANYRLSLVKNQSARCICGYVYSGASVFESTTDMLFSGATINCENGSVISAGKRFRRENFLNISDFDLEKLENLRKKNSAFQNIQPPSGSIIGVKLKNEENDLRYRFIDPHPFVPSDDAKRRERCMEIFDIQSSALAKRMEHIHSKGTIIGISGGLDSTLALLVAVRAHKLLGLKASDVTAVTMPGFGTTDRTYTNALKLVKSLGAELKEIDIKPACIQHFSDIGQNINNHDITYENTQARERTQILFDLANKEGKLLVGTGDLSELAMGWCTYNGDHMSMYGVNASVPKTLVKYLVRFVADSSKPETAAVLYDILDTPVSPELLPPDKDGNISQKTESNIGPYELHDFFIYNFVRFSYSAEKLLFISKKAFKGKYSDEELKKWINVFFARFFASQFKRSCVPDSPKVGSVSLSPRGDWRMPSDAVSDIFKLKEE